MFVFKWFCISTSKNIPDVGLITMTENLNKCREIHLACSLPIIADVDDGFGDSVIVKRMLKEYENAGIAGICMEDNIHPKRNSLFTDLKHQLVPINQFVEKIDIIKNSQIDPDFIVIARIEAFIAGMGIDEVLERANAYSNAGADLLLIHSNKSGPEEVFEFTSRWDGNIPLVAVPSTYSNTSAQTLYDNGYKVTVFANQAFRASLNAMENAYQKLYASQSISSVEKEMKSLADIYKMVNYSAVEKKK
ncbi:MAG: phosphoenolpyruvate phosphomutase [Cytophagia bacterium]|jgi:phosphoenolpyruvate phosphomutase|nr:phosphoenolpyruvate phosphomutase [Cytophagia bacterium]